METQLKKPSTNSVGNWSPEEDEIILQYVYEKGKLDEHMMWGNLSETLNGRSGKSCRERWFNHLDPKIKRTEWSQAEQWVLFILRNQNGEKWSLISKKLMGRTDNAVKNYWNSRLKKRIDSMQHAVEQHFQRKGKQKIALMLQRESQVSLAQQDSLTLADQENLLGVEQKTELDAYLERSRAEYLQRILEQVNQQNIEYFENLCCEYTLQKYRLEKRQLSHDSLMPDPGCSVCQGIAYPILPTPDGKLCECLQRRLIEKEDQVQYDEVDHSLPFMNKLSIINMHLEILYKSVLFLDPMKIAAKLSDYRKVKQLKRRQEQEWQAGQVSQKKRTRMIVEQRTPPIRERSPAIEEQPEICQDEIDDTHSVLSNDVAPKEVEPPTDLPPRIGQLAAQNAPVEPQQSPVVAAAPNMEKIEANLHIPKSEKPKKPSIEPDCVSRNLRRRDIRPVQDQCSSKSKAIKKLRSKAHRRFSNEYARDDLSDGEPSNDDYKQLLKDQHVKSSPKNAVLRKILQTMAKQRRQAQTINKIFEATKEESVGRSAGPANVVDPALFKTDSNVFGQSMGAYGGSQNDISSDEELIPQQIAKNMKELKAKVYSKKKASLHGSASKQQVEQPRLKQKLPGRKLVKANGIVGKRQKSKVQPEKGQNQIPKSLPQDNQNIIISQFNSAEINKMLMENKLQNPQVFHERMLPPNYYQELLNQQQMYPQGMPPYPAQVVTNQTKFEPEGPQSANSQNCNIHNINIQRVVQNYYINTHDSNSSGSYAQTPNFQINKGPYSHQMQPGQPPYPTGQAPFPPMQGQFYPPTQGPQMVMQHQFSAGGPESRPPMFIPPGYQGSMEQPVRAESDIIARDSLVASDKLEEGGSQPDSKRESGSMKAAAASRGKRTGSSTNEKNKAKKKQIQKNFSTKQFMNLTMTQVYQGRDREVNPLFKRKSAFQNLMSSEKPMSPYSREMRSSNSPNQISPQNSNQAPKAVVGPQSSLISPKRVQNDDTDKLREQVTPSFAKNQAYGARRDSTDEAGSALKHVSMIQLDSIKKSPPLPGAKLSPKVRELMTNINEPGTKSPNNDSMQFDNIKLKKYAQTEVKQPDSAEMKQKRVDPEGRKLFDN